MKTNVLACGFTTLLATLGFFVSYSQASELGERKGFSEVKEETRLEFSMPKYRENYLDFEDDDSEIRIDRKGYRVKVEGEYRTEFMDFSFRYEPSKDKYSVFAGKKVDLSGVKLELGCRFQQDRDFCGASFLAPLK